MQDVTALDKGIHTHLKKLLLESHMCFFFPVSEKQLLLHSGVGSKMVSGFFTLKKKTRKNSHLLICIVKRQYFCHAVSAFITSV